MSVEFESFHRKREQSKLLAGARGSVSPFPRTLHMALADVAATFSFDC